ncbi:MAG: helix-turn-helix transcriptional regulator [Faecalimonas sp.]|nr:helix-turn-helix transcriptional regulator [Faecalimonas sp.]
MAATYKKLWKLLIDKEIKKSELQKQAEISGNVLARLNRDEYVSMESLEKICKVLKCDIGDIIEFVD